MRIALLLLALPAFAASEFCLTVAPEPLKASELMLGSGRDYGMWQLSITGTTGPVSRGAITERLPFAALYEWQAVDVLGRKSSGSRRAAFAAYWGVIKDAGPAGLAFGAARTKDPRIQAALVIAAGVWALAGGRVAARAPNPTATQAHLLPDAGVPGDFDGVIITGLVRGAAKIGPICQ